MDTLEIMPVRVRITAILREAIYSGEYKSGDELRLTDVAAQLGVSRTPVREAFQVLASEGLITLRMNKGAIVNTIDRKFVQDIFEMRILLESEAAARAARNGMETEALLKALFDLRDRLDHLDKADYISLNQRIHSAVWQAADNHQLKSYLMEMWNGPSVGTGENAEKDHFKNSTDEHITILEAIRSRDPEAARAAMARHITRSMGNILANYLE